MNAQSDCLAHAVLGRQRGRSVSKKKLEKMIIMLRVHELGGILLLVVIGGGGRILYYLLCAVVCGQLDGMSFMLPFMLNAQIFIALV